MKIYRKMVQLAFTGNTARKLQGTNNHLFFSIITQKYELGFVLLWYIYDSTYDLQKARMESFS